MAAPAYKSSSTATVSSGNASFSIAAPSPAPAAGDYQLVGIIYASSSGDVGTTPAGWSLLDNTAMTFPSGDTGRVALYENTTGATAAFAMTFTAARVWAAIRACYTLPAGSPGRSQALAKNIETSTGGTSHTTPSVTTTVADSLVVVIAGCEINNSSQAWTGFGSFTSRVALQGGNTSEREAICLADSTYAAPTSGITTTFTSAVADEAGLYAVVLDGVSAATPSRLPVPDRRRRLLPFLVR